ncbi:hypothetical protein [Streptomyces sp. NPDC058989]|uniref:hypothetical protein n=1 Tax=Streptomyces sp. NPDC058989 TaxID=3346686 RepID=UPI0036A86E95
MFVRADQFMEMLRCLTDQDARKRELGADKVTDWVGSYSREDGRMLVGVLSILAACERDHGALEAQLNALLELGAGGHSDLQSLAHLREIDLEVLPDSLGGYVNDLLETT